MHVPTLLSLLLSTFPLALAASLRISIPSSPGLPNPSTLPSSTHAVLLGPAGISHDVPIRKANDFLFRELEPAGYLLTVHTRDYVFPPLRIDVSGEGEGEGEKMEAWQTFRGNEWSNKGPSYGSTTGGGELHVLLSPTGGKDYYQPRGGFNVLSFLKSPMILMGLVSVVFIFGLPYLMDNMDPEMKAEFEEMQKKGPVSGGEGASAANAMQNFDLAGWMAGKGQGGGSGGGGGGKKK